MKVKHNGNARLEAGAHAANPAEQSDLIMSSVTGWNRFRNPDPTTLTDQPLDYSTEATALATPMFEALHRMAGNLDVKLAPERPTAQSYEGYTLAECLRQFGSMCYTLHRLVEQVTPNLDSDYHPHQTVAAGSDLLRELACLAFQIEPCFSDPEELEAVAGPLTPERLPHIVPIAAEDFQT